MERKYGNPDNKHEDDAAVLMAGTSVDVRGIVRASAPCVYCLSAADERDTVPEAPDGCRGEGPAKDSRCSDPE